MNQQEREAHAYAFIHQVETQVKEMFKRHPELYNLTKFVFPKKRLKG